MWIADTSTNTVFELPDGHDEVPNTSWNQVTNELNGYRFLVNHWETESQLATNLVTYIRNKAEESRHIV
jgi:hypothetical protein